MQSVTIGRNQAGQRFDKFLHKYLPEAGNGFLYKMLRKKNITLNGRKAEGREILAEGDVVQSFFSEETFAKFAGRGSAALPETDFTAAYRELKGITILYEDEHIVAVNKPAGVLSQKAESKDLTLNEWLTGYLLASGGLTEEELATFHPSVCNRLDRNTSGIVLCGKSLAGSQALSHVFKNGTLRKFYRTICLGVIREDLLLEGYLEKDSSTNKVTVGKRQNADYIRTAFRPLAWTDEYTLLEAELLTGRTHQIRAHLSSIGHPVIGDGKYGNRTANEYFRAKYGLKNQLLHAYRVEFPDMPEALRAVNGQEIVAPCPVLFQRIEEELGFD